MGYEGQMAIDAILFILAVAFSLVSIAYIGMLWSLRRNFFIVMRSPRLACALGLLSTLYYLSSMYVLTLTWADESTRNADIATLISFPAIFAAEIALIMTAVRLLVIYYPSQRAKWGRFTREVPLTYGLAGVYVSTEIALWSSAWSQDLTRVAGAVTTLRPLSAFVAVVAAVGLGGRLRRVDDAGNMSHDIRVVGAFMLGNLCLFAVLTVVRVPFLAEKYFNIMFLWISHPPIVWICIIRPVQEVVRHIPERRRSTVETLLVSPHRRPFGSTSVAITANSEYSTPHKGIQACDKNRLASIMSFLPLREAFGEFCRRSLCSESFQFLLDVVEFRSDIEYGASIGEERNGFKGFGSFLAIVNDYIKDGAHSEVNIESRTKSDIMKHSKFKAYALLDVDGRKDIFSAATGEIGKMLVDNLLNRFLVSAQYKAVVDFEAVIPRKGSVQFSTRPA